MIFIIVSCLSSHQCLFSIVFLNSANKLLYDQCLSEIDPIKSKNRAPTLCVSKYVSLEKNDMEAVASGMHIYGEGVD